MFVLNYLHKITISDVPLQWMTRIELFSPNPEQFPLMYVHLLVDNEDVQSIGDYNPDGKQRIFGFVLTASWGTLKANGLCDIEVKFVCNIPQNHHDNYDTLIKSELSHRIGLADKVSFGDLNEICENAPSSLPLLQKIWNDKIEVVYGKYIPHGRIFDEMYGIIRFSASGNAPKLGKTSEQRMLYWYMQDLGEKVVFGEQVSHLSFLEFYILPTYQELTQEFFDFFPNFSNYYASTKKLWELEYTESFFIGDYEFKSAPASALPFSSDAFESRYTQLLADDYDNISKLRQVFNRMPGRLYGYIWNVMTPATTDFRVAFEKRDSFKEFYKEHREKKGSSAKVIACFLQQAFGIEALPIDTWVQAFIYYPLGMEPKSNGINTLSKEAQDKLKEIQDQLYVKYKRLDKLEKLIWALSMGIKRIKQNS